MQLRTTSKIEKVKTFVEMISADACKIQKDTGASAIFITAQGALESGWGKCILELSIEPKAGTEKRYSYNIFNIKWSSNCGYGKGWAWVWEQDNNPSSTTYRKVTWLWQPFCLYNSYEESMQHWLDLISTNPRYAKAWDQRHSVENFAKQIQACGYATAVNYADAIIATSRSLYVIEDNPGNPSNVSIHTNGG